MTKEETTIDSARASQTCSERDVSLPVVTAPKARVRKSRTSKWRALVLILVHLAIIGHFAHWRIAGKTVSPIEPSEAMYTLNHGTINAGFLFFAISIAATLVFGRFVCGWGCHFVAYQDLCTWLLRRIGIKPRPLRSRLLVLAPLILALYMFVWPSAYRWWVGAPWPELSNHLLTEDYWQTFPGPMIAILSVLVCGFGIVYFLGSKGFCTYACPYGGVFGAVDQVSLGRIVVSDACEQCGHCTATCSSNVRVHEEVASHGMVVDPGCLKCMDCVSVCPNDALSFSLHKPTKKLSRVPSFRRFDLTIREEVFLAGVGMIAFLALRGLYDQIPLLFAMGLAGITGLLASKMWHLVVRANVRFQNLQLKRGGALTKSGLVVTACMALWFVFVGHGLAVQYCALRGERLAKSVSLGDEVWHLENTWYASASSEDKEAVEAASRFLERTDRWGLMLTPSVLQRLVWLYLAQGRVDDAEIAVRRLIDHDPNRAELYRGLAGVLRRAGRDEEAIAYYQHALEVDSSLRAARNDLVKLLLQHEDYENAIGALRAGIVTLSDTNEWRGKLCRLLLELGRSAEADAELSRWTKVDEGNAQAWLMLGLHRLQQGDFQAGVSALENTIHLRPNADEAHYNLGLAFLGRKDISEAIGHLEKAVELAPEKALYHYNLAVGAFMNSQIAAAEIHIREAIRLAPSDTDAYGFLGVVLEASGDVDGALEAKAEAHRLARETPTP